jgi:hypothetical protein
MVSKTGSMIIKVFIRLLFLRSPRRWILHLASASVAVAAELVHLLLAILPLIVDSRYSHLYTT